MTPDEYCHDKTAASGSSFYYAFRFLPAERRRAITALYAFCREVDDVVDDAIDPTVAAAKLRWWRTELGSLYAGTPQHPVTRALAPFVARFDLRHEDLAQILDGMAMDLALVRYVDFKSLQTYCYRVAGIVGVLAAKIFGYRDERTLRYAETLGTAFQLTNIVRDVGEDARRNRIYLPADELKRFGVPASDILNRRHSENFSRLMAFQLERAERYYAQAYDLLPTCDRHSQRPGLMMAAIYRTLLDEIRARGCNVLNERIKLSPLRKFWIALRIWVTK